MTEIIKEILKNIPDNSVISYSGFEGANIVLYTNSKDFFLKNDELIRGIVNIVKKRIELRPDPSLCMDEEKTKKEIIALIPEEAKIGEIIFDPQRSIVIIESEKPGVAIGKSGEILKEIKHKTFWIPEIRRTPSIRSPIIEKIRQVLYENNDYRKKFLDKVGKRIYDNWSNSKKEMWIRATFLGAGRQVGRSCILLQTPESRIMLDCGVDVSAQEPKDAFPYLDAPEFKLDQLDAIIISHSHLDHVALVPYLYKLGFQGPCYMTEPVRDVASLLALDYISVSQKEARKVLFSSTDVKEMVKHTICLDFEEVTDITPDIRLTFYNSGHTLGSALCHLHIGNGLHNLLYTGDINYEVTNLLNPAVTRFPRLETLIIESTYGGKDDVRPTRQESEQELFNIIKETLEKGGKVLLPTLGVGRSQEIMLIIEKAIRNNLLPKVSVYLQGMVWDITAIHTAYPDFLSNIVKKEIFHNDSNPFLNEIFKRVGSKKEMDQVVEGGPCVIIATSGMMEGGPSVEYFKQLADNAKNSLILNCYQGPNTLGRKLLNGDKEIMFDSESTPLKVKMNIYHIPGFSGHSSRQQLLNYLKHVSPKPKKVILVHGESSKCLDLATAIHKQEHIETNAPKNLEAIRLR
ncbi:beta-CASP ribonuclease aCPSF1 [Candidatus Woesearchaeota archaeon]|nr:beta-CASP ribonuclease aCPSF1 [Candidatus Woesearchaeota archaeon]